MLELNIMKEKIQSAIHIKRYVHTIGVVDTGIRLAKKYHGDIEKVKIAALLHDCAKEYPDDMKKRLCKEYHIPLDDIIKKQIDLSHSFLGAEVAKREYGVEDEEILNAIRYHTTGRPHMTLLDQIIFISDYIEPNRSPFTGLEEIRKLADQDLHEAVKKALWYTIQYVKQKKRLLHPLTVEAYNAITSIGSLDPMND